MTKTVLVSPIFNWPASFFTGDNVAHYLPGKYLHYVCNIAKTGFHQPVHDFALDDDVSLSYVFYPEQPQHRYFKKPLWIEEFLVAEGPADVNRMARRYDFFANLYRYRGAPTPEVNSGYSADLAEINLYLVAYTYKAVMDHALYVDDLELNERYSDFLAGASRRMNPEGRPVIAIHLRASDPWDRHLKDHVRLNEELLFNLLYCYREHIVVLVGDARAWRYFRHPRVRYLADFINRSELLMHLQEYTSCLQFILSAYFCRSVDRVFVGMSGFTLFIESIRPVTAMPPIPAFWGPATFSGIDTCMKKLGYFCPQFEEHKKRHPEDKAFQHDVHHFMYYSRNESLLQPYCYDYPNSIGKVFALLQKLEERYLAGSLAAPDAPSNVHSSRCDPPGARCAMAFFRSEQMWSDRLVEVVVNQLRVLRQFVWSRRRLAPKILRGKIRSLLTKSRSKIDPSASVAGVH